MLHQLKYTVAAAVMAVGFSVSAHAGTASFSTDTPEVLVSQTTFADWYVNPSAGNLAVATTETYGGPGADNTATTGSVDTWHTLTVEEPLQGGGVWSFSFIASTDFDAFSNDLQMEVFAFNSGTGVYDSIFTLGKPGSSGVAAPPSQIYTALADLNVAASNHPLHGGTGAPELLGFDYVMNITASSYDTTGFQGVASIGAGIVVTPIPPAFLLFLSGLVGLVAVGRRRRMQAAA